jgi:hypothetical protein
VTTSPCSSNGPPGSGLQITRTLPLRPARSSLRSPGTAVNASLSQISVRLRLPLSFSEVVCTRCPESTGVVQSGTDICVSEVPCTKAPRPCVSDVHKAPAHWRGKITWPGRPAGWRGGSPLPHAARAFFQPGSVSFGAGESVVDVGSISASTPRAWRACCWAVRSWLLVEPPQRPAGADGRGTCHPRRLIAPTAARLQQMGDLHQHERTSAWLARG